MTLTQLIYAVAVDTHRHFGRAAEACHVAQPTLSMQLQKLEDELGVQLFDRSRHPVLPTDLGARVLDQARVVLGEAERIPALIQEAAGTIAGTLHLGIIPTLAPYVLPLVTAPFAAQYPEVEVVVREMTTQHILDHLATDRLDAGLIATAEARSGLTTQPLFTEPFVAYVGQEHRLAQTKRLVPRDVGVDDLWLLQEGHCFRDQVLQVCGTDADAGRANPVRFESGNLETLRILVDRSGGMTLLPYLATLFLSEREEERVRHFELPAPHRTVRVAYGRAYLKRPLIEAYAETIRKTILPILTPDSASDGEVS